LYKKTLISSGQNIPRSKTGEPSSYLLRVKSSDGSGSKNFDPGRVGSIFCGSVWVGSDIYGFGLNFENFPKNVKFFNFFPSGKKKLLRVGLESTRVKAGSASYFLRVKSKLGSGRAKAHL